MDNIKGYSKITTGFVTQKYQKKDNNFVCIEQNFTAGDIVDYETDAGDAIVIDTKTEQYCFFDMIQPQDQLDNNSWNCLSHCPHCNSKDIDWQNKGFDANISWQNAVCNKCGYHFQEVYKYSHTELGHSK